MSTTTAREGKRYEVRQVPSLEAGGPPQYQVFGSSLNVSAVESPESELYASAEEAESARARLEAASKAVEMAMGDKPKDEAPADGEQDEDEKPEEEAKEVRAVASGNLFPRDLTGRLWEIVVIQEGLSSNRFNYPAAVLERDHRVFESAPIRVTWNELDHHDEVGKVRDVHVRVVEGKKAICGMAEITDATAQKRMLEQFRKGQPLEFSIDAPVRAVASGNVQNVTRFVGATEVTIVRRGAAGGRALRAVAGAGKGEEGSMPTDVETRAKEAAERALRAAEQLEHQVKVAESKARLAHALAESKLPEPVRERVRESCDGRALTDAEIADAIKKEREYLGRVTAGARVTGCGVAGAEVGAEPRDKIIAGLEGFFSHRDVVIARESSGGKGKLVVPRFKSLRRACEEFHGGRRMAASEVFQACLGGRSPWQRARESGIRVAERAWADIDRELRARESVIASTFADALHDTINKRMLDGFATDDRMRQLRLLAGRGWGTQVNDFRAQTRFRVGGYGLLPTVAERGTYNPLTSPADEKGSVTLAKKGGTEDITLETLANDDQRVLAAIPDKLRLAALETLFQEVFDLFVNNSNAIDGSAIFRSGNKTSSAFAKATMNAARKAMRQQTNYGDTTKKVGIANLPKIWWGPADLEEDANILFGSSNKVDLTNDDFTADVNLHKGVQVEVVDYWTDTADCHVQADPMLSDGVEVGFFEGREEPELQVQDMPTVGSPFDIDAITYKIRFIYLFGVLEHRSFYGFSRA